MFKRNIVEVTLKNSKKKRIRELSNNLDNIVFLDFDGVINLDLDNYSGPFTNKDLINNLNNFCLDYNFKIVISSSWKKYSNYKEILYNSGLNKNIEIIGITPNLNLGREKEILKYLEEHPYTNKFIVLDDKEVPNFEKYQIKTNQKLGFDNEKLQEAINLIAKF